MTHTCGDTVAPRSCSDPFPAALRMRPHQPEPALPAGGPPLGTGGPPRPTPRLPVPPAAPGGSARTTGICPTACSLRPAEGPTPHLLSPPGGRAARAVPTPRLLWEGRGPECGGTRPRPGSEARTPPLGAAPRCPAQRRAQLATAPLRPASRQVPGRGTGPRCCGRGADSPVHTPQR